MPRCHTNEYTPTNGQKKITATAWLKVNEIFRWNERMGREENTLRFSSDIFKKNKNKQLQGWGWENAPIGINSKAAPIQILSKFSSIDQLYIKLKFKVFNYQLLVQLCFVWLFEINIWKIYIYIIEILRIIPWGNAVT